MSLTTIKETKLGARKFLKATYLATAGGMAIAVSALVAFGGLQKTSSHSSVVNTPTFAMPGAAHATSQFRMTFYVVGSPEQTAVVRDTERRRLGDQPSGSQLPARDYTIAIVSSDAQEITAMSSYRELAEIMDVDFVDLRVP